jgi:ATP-binding cassette, subfamily B, multidrug efflux pump
LINIVQRGSASYHRIQEFLDMPAEEDRAEEEGEDRFFPDGDVEFRDLSFRYPLGTADSLKNVSFRIPAGATVGIVGRTGSGKSTLLRVLLRLYPVPVGQIFIGGEDIMQMTAQSLRSAIGYVPQDAALFSATIGENIGFGGGYAVEEIRTAAELAVVEADIEARAEGLETLLGEKGIRLSGGQKQRVALARALIRHPRILLLDDVFAALDYRTQADLIENLRKAEAGRTTLIVSQRVAAVKQAQFIVVLEGGRICEQGTHDELIAAGGQYYKLYEQQLAVGEAI